MDDSSLLCTYFFETTNIPLSYISSYLAGTVIVLKVLNSFLNETLKN